MAISLDATVMPEDIASAIDQEPAEFYLLLAALAAEHEGLDEDDSAEQRQDFLNCFRPPLEHLLLEGNIAAGHAVNRLLQEMTKELSSALLDAEQERRRHA